MADIRQSYSASRILGDEEVIDLNRLEAGDIKHVKFLGKGGYPGEVEYAESLGLVSGHIYDVTSWNIRDMSAFISVDDFGTKMLSTAMFEEALEQFKINDKVKIRSPWEPNSETQEFGYERFTDDGLFIGNVYDIIEVFTGTYVNGIMLSQAPGKLYDPMYFQKVDQSEKSCPIFVNDDKKKFAIAEDMVKAVGKLLREDGKLTPDRINELKELCAALS